MLCFVCLLSKSVGLGSFSQLDGSFGGVVQHAFAAQDPKKVYLLCPEDGRCKVSHDPEGMQITYAEPHEIKFDKTIIEACRNAGWLHTRLQVFIWAIQYMGS